MASLEEINEAILTISSAGSDQIALLKCTSAYPAPPDEVNLSTISDLATRFGVPVGLSDHITQKSLLAGFQKVFTPFVVQISIDTLPKADGRNAFLASQTFQYNSDFLLC